MASTVAAWPTVALGEVLTPVDRAESPIAGKAYRTIGVKWWGEGVYERETIDGSQTQYSVLRQIRPGDIIINKIWARHGSVAVVQPELDGCYASSEFPTWIAHADTLEPRWMHWLSKTRGFWTQCDEKSRGTSGKNRIRPEKFLALTIPLPPLDEQRRIVGRIEALAGRIAEARGLRQAAAGETAGLIAAARLQALKGVAERSHSVSLGDVTESHDSGWSPQCDDRPALPGEWGVLKTTCVQWSGYQAGQNKALLPGYTPRPEIEVHAGDVLITRAGPINRVGISCAVETTRLLLMLSDKIVRIRPTAAVLSPFLALYLATPEAQEYFRQGKTGLAESQVNISREKLLSMPLILPPIAEQQRIANELQDMQGRVLALEKLQLDADIELSALLPSVLDRAFRGEL